ncbi:nudix-type nucleoside diphosphatase (YffH/AdpP family) [Arcticibacter pallidicorallinus]|uniref:GDP-mannose pyrophosphatase n=1 Tax=Arcticibacter pallidicorallinus TaxID=1259464 RepID=A0A2T0TXB9_9SPHI|nr:NUDIX domain-containing protein [Arcticibacter pallidicorallinus]PRY50280.1 nudix-type nucleoside diphosphatase (YffH/AdpP family) [Arcticibacter pallidicorallinus]
MSDIKIIKEETLSDKKYPLKFYTFQRTGSKGKLLEKKNEVYFRPDAVTVLLVDSVNSKFLLIKQFRLPTFLNGNETGYLVEACAGLIDEGESPEETAYREVDEETGYPIHDLTKVANVYTSAGGITEFQHLYIAWYNSRGRHGEGGGLEEEGEDIELVEMSFDEARRTLKKGEFMDAKTILLLQHYFLNYE